MKPDHGEWGEPGGSVSKHGFVTPPRHRREQPRERPDWVIVVASIVCAVSILGFCISWASPRDVGPIDAHAPAENPPNWWSEPWPSAAAGATPPAGPLPAGSSAAGTGPAGTGPPGARPTGTAAAGAAPGAPPAAAPRPGAPGAGPGVAAPAQPPQIRNPDDAAAPGSPLLTLDQSTGPSAVDLTAEGTVDWVHWGLRSPGSVTRKAGGANAVPDVTNRGPRERLENGPRQFSWRDGAPDSAVANTPTGVAVCGLDSWFTFTLPAGPQTRTLRLYGGVWRAAGRFDVSLSGAGLSRTVTVSDEGFSTAPVQFTIAFRAPAGGRLSVRWEVTKIFNGVCGRVGVHAATLQ